MSALGLSPPGEGWTDPVHSAPEELLLTDGCLCGRMMPSADWSCYGLNTILHGATEIIQQNTMASATLSSE